MITILSVDDHALLREGIASMIGRHPGMRLVGEASNGREGLDHFRALRPDVVLMDLHLPDMNGIDAIVTIRRESSNARIVVLTAYRGDVQMTRALKAGAAAYLLKSSLRKDLIETIEAVHAGRRRISHDVATEIAEHHADETLTVREIDVLRSVADGRSNKIVADVLAISEQTVKTHMRSILTKLSANDRTHAVMIAFKRGIINV
jgi:DNA-binding NarL/FixJ family response regulator